MWNFKFWTSIYLFERRILFYKEKGSSLPSEIFDGDFLARLESQHIGMADFPRVQLGVWNHKGRLAGMKRDHNAGLPHLDNLGRVNRAELQFRLTFFFQNFRD